MPFMRLMPRKGVSKGAYQGNLNCPACEGKNIRYVENVTPFRLRYRCRKCGITFQYDISNRNDIHPYAAFKHPKWEAIVDRAKGRKK